MDTQWRPGSEETGTSFIYITQTFWLTSKRRRSQWGLLWDIRHLLQERLFLSDALNSANKGQRSQWQRIVTAAGNKGGGGYAPDTKLHAPCWPGENIAVDRVTQGGSHDS